MIFLLFFTVYITLMTHFIVSVLWLCLVVHTWVEVTFDIFTTVIAAYRYREMGTVSKAEAERATYIAVMLFFLTAVIGVDLNLY